MRMMRMARTAMLRKSRTRIRKEVLMARIINRKTEVPQVVAVNVATLSQGMKKMFEGCAMIFDSLGADGSLISAAVPGAPVITPVAEESKAETTDVPAKIEPVKEEVSEEQKAADKKAADQKAADQKAEVQKTADQTEATEGTEPAVDTQKAAPQKASSDSVSTVTVNDIIRIASAKITANRKNSEKIGALVRSYGVSKMSELPEDKFEAFLTDISQL
jgi:hypothetical protein